MEFIINKTFAAAAVGFGLLLFSCGKTGPGGSGGSAKDPHFQLLSPAQTGVEFKNIIDENPSVNYLTLNHLYLGGAVGCHDFDKDGRPDLFFVSTMGQPKLYLNRGDFKFEDATEKSGIGHQIPGLKTGIAIADVDGNGWPDIYLCRVGQRPEERGNLLFLNTGNALFEESASKVGLDTRCASTHASFLDFDLDGDLDCYIINRPANFSTVTKMRVQQTAAGGLKRETGPEDEFESDRLMRNDGGHFTEVSKKAGIQNRKFSLSLSVQDFNSDGWPDIYVANDYIEPDILYINNRDGTFTDQFGRWFRHTSHFSMGSDAADLNNDGLPDLVSLDMNPEERSRQNIMATPMVPDRFNTLLKYGYGQQFMRNMLQVNTGAGFTDVGCLAGIPNTDWSWSPLAQDFDNDGWKDLFISNGFKRDVNDLDFVTYTMDSLLRTTHDSVELWKALQTINTQPLHNYLFKNSGDLTFSEVSNSWGLGEKGLSNAAIWADLDGDGDLDLVVNRTDQPAAIYQNLSREKGLGHYLQAKLEGPKGNPDGLSTKLRATTPDGRQQYWEVQPTRGFMSTVEPLYHVGLGQNTTVSKLEIQWPDGKFQVLENLPADQRITLKYSQATGNGQILPPNPTAEWHEVSAVLGINFVHKENPFDDFTRERLIPHKMSNQGPPIATGDLNGDGMEDFYVGGAFGSRGSMFFQQADGRFAPSQSGLQFDTLFEDVDALIFDADRDGDNDLFVVSGGNEAERGVLFYYDRLYLNDGKANFSFDKTGSIPREDESGGAVEPLDFDGDGDIDLFIGGRGFPGRWPQPSAGFVLQNNGGKFGNATPLVAPGFEKLGMVTDIKFGDLDGDQKPELIACGEFMPIAVFKNNGGKFELATEKFGLKKSGGWWNSLSLADLDGDGDLDIAAGNQGLNTRYRASIEKPLEVFAKDFDSNGSLDPLLCQWEGDRLFPVPYRDQMLKQLPPLKKKFVRYAAYSTAVVQDFYPKSDLDAALHLTAEELASGWFENQKGRFVFHPFPNEAQVFPVKSLISSDFEGDGDADLFLAGNDWGFEVESGRCDSGSGLMLMNDGKGNFSPKGSRETGINASLDARRAVLLKSITGRNLLLVGNNGGPLQVWAK